MGSWGPMPILGSKSLIFIYISADILNVFIIVQ